MFYKSFTFFCYVNSKTVLKYQLSNYSYNIMAPRGKKPKSKNEQNSTEYEKNRFIILPGKLLNWVLNALIILLIVQLLYSCFCVRCFNKR